MQGTKDTFANPPATFGEITVKDIDGKDVQLGTLTGPKAFLVVNVASECGLTKSNYTELTQIYNNLADKVTNLFFSPYLSFFTGT